MAPQLGDGCLMPKIPTSDVYVCFLRPIMVMEIRWLHTLSLNFEQQRKVCVNLESAISPISHFPSQCNSSRGCVSQATNGIKEKRGGKMDKIQTISGTNFSLHSPVTQSECNSQSNYTTILKYHSDIWGNATFCTGSFGSCEAEPCRQQSVKSKHSSTFVFTGEQEFPAHRWDVTAEKVPFISGWSFKEKRSSCNYDLRI